ncbi:MAG: flagella basal body P-ring formation protein FlgA [Ramlibacter sp.]|uniref:flagella basal body P-ring formation protein FlgA n=1 Tax=Ramlibacter sp. TaxID=1917967 RepID=UPI0026264CFE|nr:flagella basal body P-ring formation protein FlgA [Ramlibacter sp.]MDH4376683.1 flagella basal body P-ring formation protein FlgA [Ramlibacter sp.]
MPCLDFLLRTDTPATGTPAGVRPAPPIGGAFWTHQTALGVLGLACALAASANPAPIGAVEPEVVQRARAWVASIHQVSASAVQVQPLDPRLLVAGCAAGWAFDKPFPQNDGVVRARCQDTQWSLFLSVSLPRGAAAARPTPVFPGSPNPVPPAMANGLPAVPAPAPVSARPGAFPAPVPATFPTTTWMPGAIAPTAAPPTPLAVRRGNTVLTTWAPTPGLAVTARLESLDDGRLGDTIRLRNRDSGRVVSAQISGQNQAVGQ